ncbi:MAG: hypothetical protein P9X24_11285 [Candidatus Hatepunaea meridiana]|nr:hypothetical protein [Candidatus Hatepunaea meridiana]
METLMKLVLEDDPYYEAGPYHVLRKSRPYVEYIQNESGGFYLRNERGTLRGYKLVFLGKREATLKREYRQLVTSGIVSCPSDAETFRDEEEIFENIMNWLERVLVLGSEGELAAMAAYAMMTWFVFCYDSVPYLRFLGEYGTGKSTALRALSELCYRAVNISGVMSPAPIYRLIKQIKGTLVIDEADLRGSIWHNQVIRILNHGYTRGVAVVRLGCNREPETFEPFGPKVIATRAEFSDPALESRCLTITMKHRNTKDIMSLNDERILEGAAVIRNKLLSLRMAYANMQAGSSVFRGETLKPPEHWEPRVKQIVQPLYDFTPVDYHSEIKGFMEAVNVGYCEALRNGPEEQVKRILRRADSMGVSRMWLAEVYQLLDYKCRKRNTRKSVSRILERIGAYRRHGREGTFYTWESDIFR